jgi:hypothetical protein
MKQIFENYQKYRWFFTSSEKLVIGGKNAIQNEELLHLIKKEGKNFRVMHTSSPGSPFSIILEDPKKIKKQDIEEAAIFTACFSQAWKSGKKCADIDIFNLSQLSKPRKAKIGTWQVSGNVETLSVPLELYLVKQNSVLRAVPEKTAKSPLFKILPGKIDKKDLLAKIQIETKLNLSKDEILSALPAGGIKLEKIK